MSQDEVYEKAGFGGSVPRGTRPAVVVVDFTYGFTDTVYPTAADMHAQIARTRAITDLARSRGFPVIYTTIAYQPWEVETLAWLRKATGMRALLAGSRLVEIDAATGISDGDPIVEKHGASAFHGTNLAAMLTGAGRYHSGNGRDYVRLCPGDRRGCSAVWLQRSGAARLLC